MSEIERPVTLDATIESVSELLGAITDWHAAHRIAGADAHRRIWYRGHSDTNYQLWPGVYRPDFTRAAQLMPGTNVIEDKRRWLEREMLSEFRTSGATLLDASAEVQTYFLAQHHGMPTRLLDWTTNPLTALFFAIGRIDANTDGDVFVMDARRLIPPAPDPKPKDFPSDIVTMRHPYAFDAIGESFWRKPKLPRTPLILPLRPDSRVGRISQQSSCFTLHMHEAGPRTNSTMCRIHLPAAAKENVLAELRRLNVNEFSIYGDLDHLSKDIKMTRRV